MKRRRRRRKSRLLGLLLLLALTEGALQSVGPIVQRVMERRDGPPPAEAAFSVLCVGDSNTYGLHLPRTFAYPALLEQHLERRFSGPVSVTNFGTPGWNTAQVAENLPGSLAEIEPDVVLVLAGINDTWNTDAEDDGPFAWLGRLKLVRLARVLAAGITTSESRSRPFEIRTDEQGEFVVVDEDGSRRVNQGASATGARSGDALRAAVRRGLEHAVDACRDAGAVPVLMTYAEFQGEFATVADVAREVAAEREVLLVDHQRAFRHHFAERGYEALMFDDHHPNAAGYRLMADGADAALAQAGLVPAVVRDTRSTGPRREPECAPNLSLRDDGTLLVQGPAGWTFQILASGEAGPGDQLSDGAFSVPLRADDALSLSRLEPGFSGRLAAEGAPRIVTIPARLRAAAGGGALSACVLLLRDPDLAAGADGGEVAAVSAVLRIP